MELVKTVPLTTLTATFQLVASIGCPISAGKWLFTCMIATTSHDIPTFFTPKTVVCHETAPQLFQKELDGKKVKLCFSFFPQNHIKITSNCTFDDKTLETLKDYFSSQLDLKIPHIIPIFVTIKTIPLIATLSSTWYVMARAMFHLILLI